MRRWLREPLLHFLMLGVLLFVSFRWLSRNDRGEPGTITVSRGRIESIATTFGRTWQRPPTASELDDLIRDYVRDEAASREAVALGLDRDDIIIRRRLRQKLEFLSQDLAAQIEPTEGQLDTWLKTHSEAFRAESRFTFSQVYFNPELHVDRLARDIAHVRAELQRAGGAADLGAWGDAFLLQHRFEALPASEVATQFGDAFASALSGLAPGRWQGPIRSGYGMHLVFVHERTESSLPALAQVRDAVRRDWQNAQRLEATETYYRELLKRYTVIIEPGPVDTARAAAKRPSSGDPVVAKARP